MSSTLSTSTSSGTNDKDKEEAPAPFQVQKKDILQSNTTCYLVMDFNGEGCFGKVAKCLNLITNEMVAVKVHKRSEDSIIQREVTMLEAVRALDPDKKNIVRFMEHFRFEDLSCLAFEMLDRSLWGLMKERKLKSLTLNEIRPVTHQLLVALEALKNIGIIHSDLKPDNIMLINHKEKPYKIKLIDFGLALPVNQAKAGMVMQPRAYRAPEVNLGLPLSEAIDMWGVGCVMAYMYFGLNLFPGNCAYNWMKAMVHLLGQPEDHQLNAGKNTWMFFNTKTDKHWRLHTPKEYEKATGVKPHISSRFFDLARNLENAVQRCPAKQNDLEYEDRMAFLSLLKSCLHLDAEQRITPRKALRHPFVTMVHLVDEMETSSYADNALQFMNVSPLHNLDESDDSLINTETSYDSGCKEMVTTDLQKELSTASSHESNSLTDSSGGEDIDPEEYSTEDSNKFSDTESSIGGNSNSERSNGDNTDVEFSSGEDSKVSDDEDSSVPSFSESEIPVSTDSDDQSTFSFNFSDTEPSETCFNFDEVSALTGLEGESAITGFSKEDSLLESPSDRPPYANISVRDISLGPSAANDIATATDARDVKTGPDGAHRKNLLQRTHKFFCRLKSRVVSIFRGQNN